MSPKTKYESSTSLADVTRPGEPMTHTELPTLRSILKHGIYIQEKKLMEEDVDRRNYSISKLVKDVRVEVVNCLQRANSQFSPPVIITDKYTERKIQVA
ncbi:hypothetical protein O3P69_011013 [Scylla paramamosain]|uniref:Uncharacterized protein n=1 Tax=Scylla paramamosain TaxID=85552 RepID=A0AAW0SHZ2_SCYPA